MDRSLGNGRAPGVGTDHDRHGLGNGRDAQGGVVPGATVTLVSEARGTTTDTQTSADGDFVFPNVTAGTYTGPSDDGRVQDAEAAGRRRSAPATGSRLQR